MVQFGIYFETILPSENSRNIHLLHKINDILVKPLLYREFGKKLDGTIWSILEYIILKFALTNVIIVRCNLLRFGVNFDKILLNKNIQKCINFIQNNDIAAARLLGCSYGQLRQMQILKLNLL